MDKGKMRSNQVEWIEFLAKSKGVDEDSVLRLMLDDVLSAYDEATLIEKFAREDGFGRTRVSDGKFGDGNGNVDSKRVPKQLYGSLKVGQMFHLRTLYNKKYTIKRVVVVDFNLYQVIVREDKKSVTKTITLSGDAAADRLVDPFGIPYVADNVKALLARVGQEGSAFVHDCVWTDDNNFKRDVYASPYFKSLLDELLLKFNPRDASHQRQLRFLYNAATSASVYRKVFKKSRETGVIAIVDKIERARVLLNSSATKSAAPVKKADKKGFWNRAIDVFRD